MRSLATNQILPLPKVATFTVPTGDILIIKGDRGKLEMLSIGDYGKDVNIKCDALGLSRDIRKVEHTGIMPLEEKWVITISSQYGCSMNCTFCDVPKVGPGINATFDDIVGQVLTGINLHAEIKHTKRLNVHFARMGEPTFNWDIINAATYLAGMLKSKGWGYHPVLSTMMPRSHANMAAYLKAWMHLKNVIMGGNAGLQISINTTDEDAREKMFAGNAMTLEEISYHTNYFKVKGRKITLNFALSNAPINPYKLRNLFDPKRFIIKLTPMHKTITAKENDIKTDGDYTTFEPYREIEEALKQRGFDVLVFIMSQEEDGSRITCGNAVLSGSNIKYLIHKKKEE